MNEAGKKTLDLYLSIIERMIGRQEKSAMVLSSVLPWDECEPFGGFEFTA